MVTMPRLLISAILASSLLAPAVPAQDLSRFERVLIPISVLKARGAYGSVWTTELWFRNNSDTGVVIFPQATSDVVPSIRITHQLLVGVAPAERPGIFIFVDRSGIGNVQFQLRLFDESSPAASWGTIIPVVRESAFSDKPITLINVPTSADYRAALRIYGSTTTPHGGTDVIVRVYADEINRNLLATTTLHLGGSDGVIRPLYNQVLSLGDAFPLASTEKVRVELESTTTDVKLWAFVSVTSKTTQQVTVITP